MDICIEHILTNVRRHMLRRFATLSGLVQWCSVILSIFQSILKAVKHSHWTKLNFLRLKMLLWKDAHSAEHCPVYKWNSAVDHFILNLLTAGCAVIHGELIYVIFKHPSFVQSLYQLMAKLYGRWTTYTKPQINRNHVHFLFYFLF